MQTVRNLPTLQMLPPPPLGKEGWPWTPETLPISEKDSKNSESPKISIVTPSFNQGEFIEETIRSVLLQGYPNLEYIIIDGGSSDNSLEIIRKYEPWISYWISEPDRGQSHGINKGFEKSTGTILAWLNSDDLLKPNALHFVAKNLRDFSTPTWLVGGTEIIDASSQFLDTRFVADISRKTLISWLANWFPQQSTFWNRSMWERVRPLDEKLHYTMDLDLWLSTIEQANPIYCDRLLSCYRYQPAAKTQGDADVVWQETLQVFKNYLRSSNLDVTQKREIARAISQEALVYANRSSVRRQIYHYLLSAIEHHPSTLLTQKFIYAIAKLVLGRNNYQFLSKLLKP